MFLAHARPIAVFALLHLAVYIGVTLLHQGLSLDELPDRAWWSRLGGTLERVLGYPYRVLARPLFALSHVPVSPVLVVASFVASSLLWGAALHGLTSLVRTRDSRTA